MCFELSKRVNDVFQKVAKINSREKRMKSRKQFFTLSVKGSDKNESYSFW